MIKKENEKELLLNEKEVPATISEYYKVLGANIDFACEQKKYNKLMVASCLEGETSAAVAFNLGHTLSVMNKKVIIVDCRRGAELNQYLHLKGPKISGLFAGKCSLEDCIFSVKDSGVKVIRFGAVKNVTTSIFTGKEMKQLLTQLEEQFDYIIFHVAPVTESSDSIFVGKLADATILVVKRRETSIHAVKCAQNTLTKAGVEILGTILTNANTKKIQGHEICG